MHSSSVSFLRKLCGKMQVALRVENDFKEVQPRGIASGASAQPVFKSLRFPLQKGFCASGYVDTRCVRFARRYALPVLIVCFKAFQTGESVIYTVHLLKVNRSVNAVRMRGLGPVRIAGGCIKSNHVYWSTEQ